MPKYIIERTVPGAGGMTATKVSDLARDADIIFEHARCGGFPVDSVRCVEATINPTNAEDLR